MTSIRKTCQTVFKEILQSGTCTVQNKVSIFVISSKYKWLHKVLPVAAECLYQYSLSDLKALDGYEVIKRNGVVLEKRLNMIERGRNYKHYCFFQQRLKAWKVFSDKELYKLQCSQSVWMDDEYRCTKKHWSLADFLKSPAAHCKPCMISIKDGIEKCFVGMGEDLNIILNEEDAERGELYLY